MEPMTFWSPQTINEYRKILRRGRLNPGRIASVLPVCDEEPLYSRYSQLDFLADRSKQEIEETIFRMAVQYWLDAETALVARPLEQEYAQFLSIWEWDADDFPKPYFFFCSENPRHLRDQLELSPPTSETSRLIRSYLDRFEVGPSTILHEDRVTLPGSVRVLVDFALPCSPRKFLLQPRDDDRF